MVVSAADCAANLWLIRLSTPRIHSVSAVLGWHSRIFLACRGTTRKVASVPESAVTDAKYSSRRSSRNSA